MTTVTGQIVGPDGTAPPAAADRRVVITLVDQAGRARVGYTADDREIVAVTEVTADADGTWSVQLPAQDSVDSDWGDTLFRVDAGYDPHLRQPYSAYISVPASGTYWVGDIRTSLPGSAGQQMVGYLPLTGGTLTGPLTLAGAPSSGLHAATKTYVDNAVAAVSGGGGSGVSSFNGRTGAVTLLAADVPNLNASVIASGTLDIVRIPTGTTSSTVAIGNDSRITGALQATSNLSDLASAGTARTNLGLGGAALLNVGTTAGTVAAGDDTRITGAVPTTRLVSTGTGLTGGGDLSADRTLSVSDRDLLLRDALRPSGRYETRSRLDSGINSTTMTSGVLYLVPIWLPSGLAVATITFVSGNTALAGGSHQWFGLYDSSRVQLATTTNDTSNAWNTNTAKTLNVATTAAGAASSYTTTYTGLHYLGFMVAATTMPTVMGGGAANVALVGATPAFGGANTAQTTPPAFPFTASSPTLAAPLLYGYVTT